MSEKSEMTLRDVLAAKAMCGLLSAGYHFKDDHALKVLAGSAYEIADAMLEVRASADRTP